MYVPMSHNSQNLSQNVVFMANNNPTPTDENHTDLGNGYASNSYWVGSTSNSGIHDTWLNSSNPEMNYGSDNELKIGYSSNGNSRWNSLYGINLNHAGLFTNITVQSATLSLYVKQFSGQPTIRSWICYDESWEESTTDWNDWDVGGALGNQDSGGLMDEKNISSQGVWVEIDVTQALLTGHYNYRTGSQTATSILLTGAASGDDWVIFDSSDSSIISQRPRLNITYSWGSSTPSSNIQWVDVYPKEPHVIDADNQLYLEAQGRNGLGQIVSGMVAWTSNQGSINSAGIFTPIESGFTQIEATIGGVTGTLNLEVMPGTPISLDLETTSIALTIDDGYQFNWSITDSNNNEVWNAALTWYANHGSVNNTGYYLPNTIGQDSVTVMWQSLSVTADISVSAGAASFISIQPNLSVASGNQIPLIYTVTDRLGNPLPNQAAGTITWGAENGFIDSVGIYTGEMVGTWLINATSTSGAFGHTYVEVTPGELSSIELVAPNGSQFADQPVLLIVNWLDIRGNNVPVKIPLSNWTSEDGNFRMTPQGVEWLPRREGNWTVGVHVEDKWDNITINVVHGAINRLLIVTDSETISADVTLNLNLMAEDSKGNRWSVNGTWITKEPMAAPWLTPYGNNADFEGNLVGNWTIQCDHGNFSTNITLKVLPGSLALIELQGDGTQLSADESHNFAPRFFDEDGNELFDIQLNWTFDVNGQEFDRTSDMRSNDGWWYPVLSGHHEIEVDASGVFSSLGLDVTPGIAHTLRSIQTNGIVIQSGNNSVIQINATDLDGNDFGTDVEWILPHNSVELTNGSRAGEYIVTGLLEGTHVLQFHSGLADSEISVVVQSGEIISLEIIVSRIDVQTGETVDIEIFGTDYGGNQIQINPDDVTIESSAGNFGYSSENYWQMLVTTSGQQQLIEVKYGSIQGEVFIDVSADPLKAFGDSNFATSLWAGISLVALLFILLLMLMKKRSKSEIEALEHHFGTNKSEKETKIDPMAGYKPSKKARAAARKEFNMKFPHLAHSSWAGYNQAQMNTPFQKPQFNMKYRDKGVDQEQTLEQENSDDVNSQNVTENNSEEIKQHAETSLDEAPWTTEQVWEWGRGQNWNDEQIAAYEQIYDQSVRNPAQFQDNQFIEHQQTEIVNENNTHSAKEDVREKGIMKAMPGTTQGEAGWYLDGEGNPSRWEIDEQGQWHRVE